MQQQFTIHPIGQGLFYSGFLELHSARFDMVFDCGSKNPSDLSREILRYRAEREIDQYGLDLLVISHFDNDHVSGIDELLQGVKVRRLVLPFLNFRERLYLVTRTLLTGRGYKPALDFTLRVTIDPLGTLGDHLDGDTQVFFVQNSPDPIPPDDNEGSPESGSSDEQRFSFDFVAKSRLDEKELDSLGGGQTQAALYKVQDREKGMIKGYVDRLMDFLFYKKSLGICEDAFYQEVIDLFLEKYGLTEKSTLEEIMGKVREIRTARPIREIFNKAKAKCLPVGVQVGDLNITALCLFHLNRPELYRLTGESRPWFECNVDAIYYFKDHSRPLFVEAWPVWLYAGFYPLADKMGFPNVMLTSDTVLLEPADVGAFQYKYQYYLGKQWLTQIPHHGSDNNSDELFFQLVQRPEHVLFVNYGLNNSFGHPSEDIIEWIWNFLIPVHERQGIRFRISRGRL